MIVTSIAIDSPLGSWTHHECRPARLAGIVDHMWHFEGRMSLPRERVFPGGYLEMILHIGPRFRDVDAKGIARDRFPHFCFTGVHTRPSIIQAPDEPVCVMGIRLMPVGAFVLFSSAAAEALDRTHDLTDVAGPSSHELADRCLEASDATQRFELVTEWVLARLTRSKGAHRAIAWAAGQLEKTHGNQPIADLRDRIGLGRSQFAEQFKQHVGLSPKRYARVLRFRHTLGLLQQGRTLSDAAFTAGYFDQAHMNADFRELAQMTPAAFVAAARYPNSPSLPERADEIPDISPRRRRRPKADS